MVLEAATIYVKQGTSSDFESSFRKASNILARASGYIGHELHKCVEEPDKYLLLVKWQSISDHIADFRKSEDYGEWQSILQPYFAQPPSEQHYVNIRL